MPTKKKTTEEVDDVNTKDNMITTAATALVNFQHDLTSAKDGLVNIEDNLSSANYASLNDKQSSDDNEKQTSDDYASNRNDKNNPTSNNEDSSDDDVPIAVAYRQRTLQSSSFTGLLSSVHRPPPFAACKDMPLVSAKGPVIMSNISLQTISYMVYLRHISEHPSADRDRASTVNEVGYSFPLKSLLSTSDRYEINLLSQKKYMVSGKKEPQVWVYYYPSTKALAHNIHDKFFGNVFDNTDDKEYIKDVGDDSDTSMICLALHDTTYNGETLKQEPTSNIISSVSFRILPESSFSEESGVYVYYLGTLQNLSFHDVVPMNGTMNDFQFPIAGNGLAEFLLRITQLLSFNIRHTYNMFLAANIKSSINKYYKKLHFEDVDDWNVVGQNIHKSAQLESEDLTDLKPMWITEPISFIKPTTTDLFIRTLKHRPRSIRDIKTNPEVIYTNKMRTILDAYVSNPLPDEKQWNTDILCYFNKVFPSRSTYQSDGPEWALFHEFLTGKSMMHYWEIKFKFAIANGDYDRTQGKIFPLEELMMDYCSFGKVIKDNDPSKNTLYNVYCQRCKCNMTTQPLQTLDMKLCALGIIEKHFLGKRDQVLSLSSPTEFTFLNKRIERGGIEIVPCEVFNNKTHYKMYFKAFKEEFMARRTIIAKMQTHTRNVFRSFATEYLKEDMTTKFMHRAMRGAFPALLSITNSLNRMHDIRITTRNTPSKFQQAVLQNKLDNEGSYHLPGEFKAVYSDLMKSREENKKKDEISRQRKMLSNITGISVEKLEQLTKDAEKIRSRRKKTKESSPRRRKKKEAIEVISDQDIKLNWKTLMLFSKQTWVKDRATPIPMKEIKNEKRQYFYIGRSDVKGQKIYFIVSNNIIPKDQNSHIFENKFFNIMRYNTEYDIPPYSVQRLQETVRDAHLYVIKWIQPTMINGIKMWKGKRRGGMHTDPQSHEWIKDSFFSNFRSFYDQCMDDNNLEKHLPVPAGKKSKPLELEDREHANEDKTVSIPKTLVTAFDVPFCFDNDAYCAFGNMANATHVFGDTIATEFFFINRHKNMSFIEEEYPQLALSVNGNQFSCALQIAREIFKYNIRNLGTKHEPWIVRTEDANIVKYIEIQGLSAMYTHVVCVNNNLIYDGTFRKCMKLSKDSFDWIAREETYLLKCYSIEPSKKLKRAISTKEINKKNKSFEKFFRKNSTIM